VNTNTSSAAGCGKSTTCTSAFDTRWNNAIAYISPSWSGFSVVGAYVANESKNADFQNGTAAQSAIQGYDLGAKFASGPWMAAVTYNWYEMGNTTNFDSSVIRLGGSYTGSNWSVRAMWEQVDANWDNVVTLNNGPRSDNTQQAWGIGGTYMIGRANLLAQYYQAIESDNKSDGAWLGEIGVEYSLSKRTMLKASYVYLDNEQYGRYDFGVNASGGVGFGNTIQGMQAGVRHAF
jgi:predicted porin